MCPTHNAEVVNLAQNMRFPAFGFTGGCPSFGGKKLDFPEGWEIMGNGLCGLAHPLPAMPLAWLILGNPYRSPMEHGHWVETNLAACQKIFLPEN